MKRLHAGMKISEAEFRALVEEVEDLVKALNALKVSPREQQELFAILSPMQKTLS